MTRLVFIDTEMQTIVISATTKIVARLHSQLTLMLTKAYIDVVADVYIISTELDTQNLIST